MKNILIFLSVITICHVLSSAGDYEEDDVLPWWLTTPGYPQIIYISSTSSSTPSSSLWTSTSSSPPPLTFPSPSQTTTARKLYEEELMANCLRGCSVTKEYNPVCGTNNVTYDNPGMLECAQRCGVYVKLRKRGRCYFDKNKTLTRSSIQACVRNCPVPEHFLPTCGTNNVTYANPERLECVVECGVVVSVDSYRPCYRYPSHEDSLIEIEFKICHAVCSTNKELVPVCGTDGRDYRNYEDLYCVRKCGLDVNIRSETLCSEHSHLSATTAASVTKPLIPGPKITTKRIDINQVMICMQHCPLTPDCEPVCGSDGVTYRNPVRLLCSQYCGIDVKLLEFGYCTTSTKAFTNCRSKNDVNKITTTAPLRRPLYQLITTPLKADHTTALPTKTPDKQCVPLCRVSRVYIPVCGSDGKMYDNIDHLICAKKCGVDVSVKKHTACKGFETPSPSAVGEFDINVRPPAYSNPPEENKSTTVSGASSTDYGTATIEDNPNNIDDYSTSSLEDTATTTDYSTTSIANNANNIYDYSINSMANNTNSLDYFNNNSIDGNTTSVDYSTTSIPNNTTSMGYSTSSLDKNRTSYSTTSLGNDITTKSYSFPRNRFFFGLRPINVNNSAPSTENSLFRKHNSPSFGKASGSLSTEKSLIGTKNSPSTGIKNRSVSSKESTTGRVPSTVQY